MTVSHWIVFISFFICSASCLFKLLQVLFANKNQDFAQQRGSIFSAIIYSFSGAMSPYKKETAYLHLPTYIAGIIYHLGTFLSFAWLIIHFFNFHITTTLATGSWILLIISAGCGLSIFIKRLVNSKLKIISTLDDFFSNLLVTGFQILSALALLTLISTDPLFIYASILFLYVPLGKLNHVIYFFTSRIHLGILFGKRGTWPPGRREI